MYDGVQHLTLRTRWAVQIDLTPHLSCGNVAQEMLLETARANRSWADWDTLASTWAAWAANSDYKSVMGPSLMGERVHQARVNLKSLSAAICAAKLGRRNLLSRFVWYCAPQEAIAI